MCPGKQVFVWQEAFSSILILEDVASKTCEIILVAGITIVL
jgi:hypothetical protein